MSDLSHTLFYEVTLTDILNSNFVLEKLLLKSQQDLALFLVKMGVPKEHIEHGFSFSSYFSHNNIGYDIIRLEPHTLKFNKLAYSSDRGDSLFEVFPAELAVAITYKLNRFIMYCDNHLEYADNYRVAYADIKESREEFESLYSCCGEYTKVDNCKGYNIIFGCNYGH